MWEDDIRDEIAREFASLSSSRLERRDIYGDTASFAVVDTASALTLGDRRVNERPKKTKKDAMLAARKTVEARLKAEAARNACRLCGREGRPRDATGACRGRTGCERSRLSRVIALRRWRE